MPSEIGFPNGDYYIISVHNGDIRKGIFSSQQKRDRFISSG